MAEEEAGVVVDGELLQAANHHIRRTIKSIPCFIRSPLVKFLRSHGKVSHSLLVAHEGIIMVVMQEDGTDAYQEPGRRR